MTVVRNWIVFAVFAICIPFLEEEIFLIGLYIGGSNDTNNVAAVNSYFASYSRKYFHTYPAELIIEPKRDLARESNHVYW